MKQLTASFSTFLKLSSLSNIAVLGQLKRRLSDNGGYNYHRSMRRSVAGIQFGGMSLDEAKEITSATPTSWEKRDNTRGVERFFNWYSDLNPKPAQLPSGRYVSESELLAVTVEPEVAFLKNGLFFAYSLWNTLRPDLTDKIAGMGVFLLRQELAKPPHDTYRFGLYNLITEKRYDELDIPDVAADLFQYHSARMEAIWLFANGNVTPAWDLHLEDLPYELHL